MPQFNARMRVVNTTPCCDPLKSLEWIKQDLFKLVAELNRLDNELDGSEEHEGLGLALHGILLETKAWVQVLEVKRRCWADSPPDEKLFFKGRLVEALSMAVNAMTVRCEFLSKVTE